MTTQAEFFQEHAVNGELTDAQMLQMMNLPEGDTSALLDGGMPDAAATKAEVKADEVQGTTNEAKTEQGAQTPATPAEPDPSKAVVLAKDGVHTIPYEKLDEARKGEQHWRAQATAALERLQELESQAQQRADNGQAPTKQDQAVATAAAAIEQGVDPSIFGDFSDQAIAAGLQKMHSQSAASMREQLKAELLAEVRAEVKAELAPIKQSHQQTTANAHYNAILEKHPDADSIAESKELADWIASQPTFARAGYQAVLQKGTTAEVIEFFDTFKAATGKTAQQTTSDSSGVADAAKAALAKAKAPTPTSLSEIPAGSKAHHDEAAALMEMSDSNVMGNFMGKSPEQIRALLDRAF